jgi:hypothetical protein
MISTTEWIVAIVLAAFGGYLGKEILKSWYGMWFGMLICGGLYLVLAVSSGDG